MGGGGAGGATSAGSEAGCADAVETSAARAATSSAILMPLLKDEGVRQGRGRGAGWGLPGSGVARFAGPSARGAGLAAWAGGWGSDRGLAAAACAARGRGFALSDRSSWVAGAAGFPAGSDAAGGIGWASTAALA